MHLGGCWLEKYAGTCSDEDRNPSDWKVEDPDENNRRKYARVDCHLTTQRPKLSAPNCNCGCATEDCPDSQISEKKQKAE
jgi:hypothetical protein